ncbi:MAG: B12-binding domain-containing radical SAM protein [Promethearchaeota archaeon]
MKVLIVDCLTAGEGRRRFSRDFIGSGPKLIAGVVNKLEIKNLFIKIKRVEDILFNDVKKGKNIRYFDICLISAMTMDIKSVRKFINFWRKENKEKTLIVGGAISSDHDLLRKIDADITVQGEGEKIIIPLFKILLKNNLKINNSVFNKLKSVRGISFRYKGRIIRNKPSMKLNLEEYNNFLDPKFYLNFIKQYDNYKSARIYVECLRGCSNYYRTKFPLKKKGKCLRTCNNCKEGAFKDRINCPANIPPGCGFCSTISSFGFPKSRNLDLIISEIKGLLKLKARRIVLGGPDLLDYKREALLNDKILTSPQIPPEPNYDYLKDLIEQIIVLEPIKNEKAQIFIENIKASLCNEKALKILSKIPNPIFSIGCETGSDEFSERLGRPSTPAESLEAIRMARSMGIRVQVYFIYGLPGEKVKYLNESMDLINKLFKIGVDKITIYKYQELPGSPFALLQEKEKVMKLYDGKINRYRKKLVRLAINFNLEKKKEMIGKKYDVFIAETSFYNKNNAIGYLLKGGPKVLIVNAANQLGNNAIVEINRVLSDKFVEGKVILSDKKRYKK